VNASEKAVEAAGKAAEKWKSAPLHVRAVAAVYVDPMMIAVVDLAAAAADAGERIGRLHERVAECEIRQGVSHGA
jgi:hypothetical protein